ncbi:MAG: hypothetical protein LQ337_001922 [Flavoplaca oasis]|nr:MAG: hypothetical protein LQ337_001922 [Flavoplaca oasis]
MPSKKWSPGLENDHEGLDIHETGSRSFRTQWQNQAHVNRSLSKSMPTQAHLFKKRLDDLDRSGRDEERVPQNSVKSFGKDFDDLYEKMPQMLPAFNSMDNPCGVAQRLLIGTGDPVEVTPHQGRETINPHGKRARCNKTVHTQLPTQFNKRGDDDPKFTITVPIDENEAVAVLKDLSAVAIRKKVREAVHEALWWFLEPGFIGWVIAVRHVPGRDLEVFVDTPEHHDTLSRYAAWKTGFRDGLLQRTYGYGVSPVGLAVSQVPDLHTESGRTSLVQALFDANRARICKLKSIADIVSIEVRPTNYGKGIVIVNLAQRDLADELIKKGIQWGEDSYPVKKYIREWSLFHVDIVMSSASVLPLDWNVSIAVDLIDPRLDFAQKERMKQHG